MHGDDEIGLQVVLRWAEQQAGSHIHPEIQTAILESPGLNLLGTIAGQDAAILVAAIRSGAPAGTVQIYQDEELEMLQGTAGTSWAGGAAETLSLGRRLIPEDLPKRLVLIGIEGAAFGLGEGLSPAVDAAFPQALVEIDRSLAHFSSKGIAIKHIARRWGKKIKQIIKGTDQSPIIEN